MEVEIITEPAKLHTVSAELRDLAREEGVLTPYQRRVFELREFHGCSWGQIAYMTDRHQATVRGHYAAAVRRIHHELERRNQA